MRVKDLRLSAKQFLAFGIILLVMLAALVFKWQRVVSLKDEVDVLATNWLPRVVAISEISLNTTQLRLTQMQHVEATAADDRDRLTAAMVELIEKIDANIDSYKELRDISDSLGLYSAEEAETYARFDEKWWSYMDYTEQILDYLIAGDRASASALLGGEAETVFTDLRADLQELVDLINEESFAAATRAEETLRDTARGTFMSLLVAAALAILIALLLVRYLTIPMHKLVAAAGQVEAGDLSAEVEMDSKDEVGRLAESFNQMTAALRTARAKTEGQSQRLRKQAEELQTQNEKLEDLLDQLRQSQEQLVMKEKMASLGRLVAGVAHEINNPIGAVNSSVDVLHRCLRRIDAALERADTAAELRADRDFVQALGLMESNVQTTAEAGKRVATIVKSLRNFAQLDEADYQRVDIHEGLESSLTLLGSEVLAGIEIERDYANLPEIGCYPAQLNQVWLNLLRNAADAIAGSGKIRLSSSLDEKAARIIVSDTGRGIPADQLENIFDFRFTAGQARVKMGSGLSVAYNVIRRHKGEITITSQPGQGTSVTVTLPVG